MYLCLKGSLKRMNPNGSMFFSFSKAVDTVKLYLISIILFQKLIDWGVPGCIGRRLIYWYSN